MKGKSGFSIGTGIIVAVIIVLVAMVGFKYTGQVVTTPSGGVGDGEVTGYTPFPVGTMTVYLKDSTNPTNAVTTSTVDGKVYSADTPRSAVKSPITGYVDSDDIDASDGSLDFTAKKIMTGTKYLLKVWDNTGSPTWYPELIDVDVPKLDPNLGASITYTLPDLYLDRIGTIADPMQSEATGAGGASLQTGVASSASSNTITINVSQATDDTITIRIPLTLSNTQTNSKLKEMVLKPIQDTTNPMSTTAFTAATVTYISGTNMGIPGNILPYVSGQTAIPLGDWDDSTSGSYYLQISLDKASLSSGDTFYFRLDDQGDWLATDDVAGQSGASSQYVKITVTS